MYTEHTERVLSIAAGRQRRQKARMRRGTEDSAGRESKKKDSRNQHPLPIPGSLILLFDLLHFPLYKGSFSDSCLV